MNIEVNYLAVLLAGVASMVVGFVWYSPMLFGKPWMKLMGHSEKNMKAAQQAMGKLYGVSFVVTLVMAYVLVHVITMSQAFFHYDTMTTGLTSGFWMWLGFVAPVQLTDVLFGGKKLKLFAINTGYQLASLLVMGVILAMM